MSTEANDKPIKLLIVTRERSADRRYGLGKSLEPVLRCLGDMGVSWYYLTQDEAGIRSLASMRVLHTWFAPRLRWLDRDTQIDSLLWGLLERLNMGRLAAKLTLRKGFTHVHFHDPILAWGFRLFLRGRAKQVRWGVTEHGFGSYTQAFHEDGARLGRRATRWLRRKEAEILQAADWVTNPTQAGERQLLRDLGLPNKPQHWHVLPHTLPTRADWSKQAARHHLGLTQDARILLSVGRLVPLKDFPGTIKAFAKLAPQRPDLQLIILGDGDPQSLVALAAELGVEERLRITATDDIWPWYAAADLYVSTSTTESFGMANLEAVAGGLPAVCTAVGGVPDVVGRVARLVPAGDPDALADALAFLLDNPGQLRLAAKAGRRLGAAWPDARAVAARCLDIYLGKDEPRELGLADDDSETRVGREPAAEGVFKHLRPLMPENNLNVLVVAPHQDDETLGCGGSLAALAANGAKITTLFLTDGAQGDPLGYCGGDVVASRQEEARQAAKHLGVDDIRFAGFPDGQLDKKDPALLYLLACELQRIDPDWVLGPSLEDAHRDHSAAAQALVDAMVQTGCRARMFAYESWTPLPGNCIVDISEYWQVKQAAIRCYELPLRYVDYHAAADGLARYRGMQQEKGGERAEVLREYSPAELKELAAPEPARQLLGELQGMAREGRAQGAESVLLCGPGCSGLTAGLRLMGLQARDVQQPWADTLNGGAEMQGLSLLALLDLPSGNDGLAVFSWAARVLAADGIFLLDEKSAEHLFMAAKAGVDKVAYFDRLARRHGFAPKELDLPGRFVFAFVPETEPRWRVRPVLPNDAQSVLRLFNEVFGHEMSAQHYQWKYVEGHGYGVVAEKSGEIVGHYGGVLRDILAFGAPGRAYQILDVMVDAKERAVLTRNGPFAMMASSFAEQAACIHAPYGFGFPTGRHMQLAERIGLYSEVGRIVELSWPAGSRWPRPDTRLTAVYENNPGALRDIDLLWRKMAVDYRDALICVRDADHVRHRFLRHPDRQYHVLLVRRRLGRGVLGALVLRRDDEKLILVDLIARQADYGLMIDQARRIATRLGHEQLIFWVTENFSELFAATGADSERLDIHVPASVWIDVPQLEKVKNNWWLTAGDTDFR